MKSARILILLLAAALAPAAGAAPGASEATAAPAPARKAPRRVKDVSCERYLQLPQNARPMLIGWEIGQGHRRGSFAAWLVDAEKASALVAAVADACRKAPDASFWYTVKAQLKALR